MNGSRQASLAAVAEAIMGEAPADRIAQAVRRAVDDGALAPCGGGALAPTVALPTGALPAPWQRWVRLGCIPFRLKPGQHTAENQRILRRVLAALDGLPQLGCVPQRTAGDWLASLHLPEATDLRDVLLSGGHPVARRVHELCLRSLERFGDADRVLRQAIRGGGLPSPPLFPVAARYRAAVAGLNRLLGPVDLPAELPEAVLGGPVTLFCDPKPANFLVLPRVGDDGPDGWTRLLPRIDLDLMCYACPVSLQIVLAVFAHPVVFHRAGPLDEQFAGLRQFTHEGAARFGVTAAEIDAMLIYHLARNFVSAATSRTPAEQTKAQALAPIVVCAIDQIPAISWTR